MIKVSVIVPCYNTSLYLRECLDSLLHQTLPKEELEIIVVNNNSTDETAEILATYNAKYPDRLRIFDQPKQGVSAARNLGLLHATGKYIGFVDSDDYVRYKMFETMYNTAERRDSDLVQCGYLNIGSSVLIANEKTKAQYQHNIENGTSIFEDPAIMLNIMRMVCNKLYKREIIQANSIFFDEDLLRFEDRNFNSMYLYYAKNLQQIREPLVRVRMGREGSITKTYNDSILYQPLFCERIAQFYKQTGDFELFKEQLLWMQVGAGGYKGFIGSIFNNKAERRLSKKYVKQLFEVLNKYYPGEWQDFVRRHDAKGSGLQQKVNTYLTKRRLVNMRMYMSPKMEKRLYAIAMPLAGAAWKVLDVYRKYANDASNQSMIVKHQNNGKIWENAIFLESLHGSKDINDNILNIIRELAKPDYSRFSVFLSVQKDNVEIIGKILAKHNLAKVKIIVKDTTRYWKTLETAKFLVTDNTFPFEFIKKDGQVYLNTWHGFPLKTLGRDYKDEIVSFGNTQKNFFVADYLLCTGPAMIDIFRKSYMLDNIYSGKFLLSGSPRNDILFDEKNREQVKNKLNLANKQVIGYMPTYRGSYMKTTTNLEKRRDHVELMLEHFAQLDSQLTDNQVMLVNLHHLAATDIDFSQYNRIKYFPSDFSTYEIMNACDILVTDYSSVMYDFAITRRKVVLFVYDLEEYIAERDCYVEIDDLPFEKARNIDELLTVINSGNVPDYSALIDKCCGYEKGTAAHDICQYIFLGKGEIATQAAPQNGKPNVLVFGGGLAANGVTTSVLNFYDNIDLTKRNYINCFNRRHFSETTKANLQKIPQHIPLISMSTFEVPTVAERKVMSKFSRKAKLSPKEQNLLAQLYRREWKKNFGNIPFSHALMYDGYSGYSTLAINYSDSKRWIWLHNDMVAEIKHRNNVKYDAAQVYSEFDVVANVSDDILKINKALTTNDGEKMVEFRNFHNHAGILARAEEEFAFDEDTKCSFTLEEIQEILSSDSRVFITIGRFSNEKGHMRLIDAFERFYITNPMSYLIILGGHGPLFQQTVNKARGIKAAKNIIVIQALSNPMPLLKQCDLFILSSFYEGFGLVITEADSLGVPVISTRVAGPTTFMEEHGGYLCENSEDGLLQGMQDFMDGKVPVMNVDFEEYNNKINVLFEELMER
ncbi:MAG: CDP-glycerol glycerophosphotransferase family protein [Defluviitaleaceae bacterium]|nr:CDP-glycerol glycerophosphotransferase family protein [Defluviitaleaceae bacterium]